ncbi:MAG: DapH/DapD/GlmU-related protein [bacterium]
MSNIKKVYSKIKAGRLLSILYEKFIIDLIPRIKGRCSLAIYSKIYANFSKGTNIRCWGRIMVRMSPESRISIGNNVRMVSDFTRANISLLSHVKISSFFNSTVIIGNGVGLSGTSITCRTTSITINDGTIIAPNVFIVDSDFHALWPPENRTYNMGYERDKPVTIGKNVWIGMNCIILKGVTIGENTIIGSGSVVVKNIPPNVVAAGNPAHVIKKISALEE